MSEAHIQSEIVAALRKIPGCICFSVPNEAAGNNASRQMSMVRTGLYPGVSDLIAIYRSKVYFLEVKTATGKQSPRQIRFQEAVTSQNLTYRVVRSVAEALDALCLQ